MAIKKVSVTKTSQFIVDGEGIVDRERIVTLSHNWTERDIILFKKIPSKEVHVEFKELSTLLTQDKK